MPNTINVSNNRGPLRVSATNPRYFTDNSGKAILLSGSHTWDNRQDLGTGAFDYTGYLDDLESWGHNFIRLWEWEQPKGISSAPAPVSPTTTLTPEIWKRTGPGNAADGGLKFDLSQYNQPHFDRLRSRVAQAAQRGFYVQVMLFNGWSTRNDNGNPWANHPFNSANNINSIDGDWYNADGKGDEMYDLSCPDCMPYEDDYVEKVIDTVNDLDNVLYEINNEFGHYLWQYHVADLIHTYEAGKPKQHPVVMWSSIQDELDGSPSEAVSTGVPGYSDNPPVADGAHVIFTDTDHIFGIGGDADWGWKMFTRGHNPVYMDSWDNLFLVGSGHPIQNFRDNLGWILGYARRADLVNMTPQDGGTSPCNTGYCLHGASQYLCYNPSAANFTVDLSGESGTFQVERFHSSDGATNSTTTTGGATRTISLPGGWTGGWSAYLYK